MQVLSTENHHLQMHLATTRQALADAESSVQLLETKLAEQEAKLAQQVAVASQVASKRRSVIRQREMCWEHDSLCLLFSPKLYIS